MRLCSNLETPGMWLNRGIAQAVGYASEITDQDEGLLY